MISLKILVYFEVKQNKKTIHDFSITEKASFFRPEFFIFSMTKELNIVVCVAFQDKPLLYLLPLRTAKHTAVSSGLD